MKNITNKTESLLQTIKARQIELRRLSARLINMESKKIVSIKNSEIKQEKFLLDSDVVLYKAI